MRLLARLISPGQPPVLPVWGVVPSIAGNLIWFAFMELKSSYHNMGI